MTDREYKPPFVFFLDMDGVLNNMRVCLSKPADTVGNMYGWIDPVCVAFINRWAEMVEAKGDSVEIVLSSTWRAPHKSWSSAAMMLGVMNVEPNIHKDFKTRTVKMTIDGVRDIRGFQIRSWLAENPTVDKWMIIDDDSDFTDEQKLRHVHTDTYNGILMDHHIRAEEIIDKIYAGEI